MNRYQSLLGVGLLFTTLTGCSAVGKTQGRRAQIATDPKDALVYITYRRDKDGHGTGFLIENKESDSCLVVTNAHVTGNHQDVRITTEKGNRLYHAESVRQFPDLDLAVVSFAMDEGGCSYPVLKLGNANQLKDGDEISVVGYPDRSDNLPLVLQTYEGDVTAIKSPQAFGYGISYNAQTYKGMSGAPVLNAKGEVIAIHGMTDEGMARLEREDLSLSTLDDSTNTNGEPLPPSFLNWGISTQLFTKDFDALPTIAEAVDQRFATFEELVRNARFWIASGFPELALELLAIAETLDANNANFWYVKGGALGDLERYDDAIVAYDQAIEIKQDYVDAWSDRGVALWKMERYNDAILAFDKAFEIDPHSKNALIGRGVTLYYLERYEDAILAFDKALEIDPHSKNALIGRGATLVALRRYENAIADLNKVIVELNQITEVDPDYAWAWVNRGSALTKSGRPDKAIIDYDRAIEINSSIAEAWYGRGYTLFTLERYNDAIADLDKAIEIDRDYSEAWIMKSFVLVLSDQAEKALEASEMALQIDPENAAAWAAKSLVLLVSDQIGKALEASEMALQIDPENAAAWVSKSAVLSLLGHNDEALVAIEEALRLEPNDPFAKEMQNMIRQQP